MTIWLGKFWMGKKKDFMNSSLTPIFAHRTIRILLLFDDLQLIKIKDIE
jgi:hypothetical protein